MYIGPWQEFKLARLIQQRHEQEQLPGRVPQLPRGSRAPGRRRGQAEHQDDVASVASSSRSGFSGFSTQSAPAQLGQPSAQSRLNDYCDLAGGRRASSTDGGTPQAPRPRSSISRGSGGSSSSAAALPSRGGRKPPTGKKVGARASAKAKAAAFEDQRRARILQMQRLYGLAASQEEGAAAEEGVAAQAAPPPAAQQRQDCSSWGPTPEVDRALSELQASMDAHEPELSGAGPAAQPAAGRGSPSPLPPLPEDPFSLSMGSSGGLIAWSKNLKPDDLSPSASLTGFFPAPT
mmetsp:Transcript_45665/g.132246  ORF Transcript_45665/g.132246 Transcript_45665/m.132246 type:complete len:291 (-) Transcript_45665:12-884(-)